MSNYKVAIVDDEIGVVRTYELLFKVRKIPVAFIALNGIEAVEKFNKANPRPDVMIIDYRLPDMDGLCVMREVRKIAPDMKVIIISADGSIRQKSLDEGANVFMKKPTGNKDIVDTIHSLINE